VLSPPRTHALVGIVVAAAKWFTRAIGAGALGPMVAVAWGCHDPPLSNCGDGCPQGERCQFLTHSDQEGEDDAYICVQPCDDVVGDDTCGQHEACVRSCARDVLVCGRRGEGAPCAFVDPGQDGERVAGAIGFVCRVDADCRDGGRCGAEHRCYFDDCAEDADCAGDPAIEVCVSAVLGDAFCGAGCDVPAGLGEACESRSDVVGCRVTHPCAPGTHCDGAICVDGR
jgi:hypothetical protein